MATRATKTSTVKAKSTKSETTKTSAPKLARARTTTATAALSYDAVAERAFVRFCARGGEHGHDVEDWLAAEAELRRG